MNGSQKKEYTNLYDKDIKPHTWGSFKLMHWMMQPKVADEPQPFRANAGAQNQRGLNSIPAPTPPSPGITYSLIPRILTVVFIQVCRTLTPGFQAPTILPKSSQHRNGISLQNLGSRPHPPARHLSPAPLGGGAPTHSPLLSFGPRPATLLTG